MKVNYYPNKISKKPTTLLLGSFESFHKGHMKLLLEARKLKRSISIMIIDNPTDVPFASQTLYADLDIRLQNISNLKIDFASVVEIKKYQNLPGKEFIEKLVNATNAKHIIMGSDFGCGFHRDYEAKQIAQDYSATIVEHELINDKKISTTLIKEFLQLGEVDLIKKISFFPFTIMARVLADNTFSMDKYPKMQKGIYATTVIVNDIEYPATVKVGFENNSINIPQFQVKNKAFKGTISFHKMVKVIVSKNQDELDKKSIELAHGFLTLI